MIFFCPQNYLTKQLYYFTIKKEVKIMKLKSIIVGVIVSIAIIIIVAVFLIIVGPKIKVRKSANVQNEVVEQNIINDEPLVANLNAPEEEQEDPEYIKTAADITQELQEMDINIGTLNIPKTGYTSEVYCKQNVNKMEEMPCMLYTNEGPNKPGVTIFVGHNRENGTLFSNNNLLEENDEFYFTDYEGNEKKYIIYSKFVTDNDDVSFYNTESEVPIIAMQCCLTANTSDKVMIIMAKAEE